MVPHFCDCSTGRGRRFAVRVLFIAKQWPRWDIAAGGGVTSGFEPPPGPSGPVLFVADRDGRAGSRYNGRPSTPLPIGRRHRDHENSGVGAARSAATRRKCGKAPAVQCASEKVAANCGTALVLYLEALTKPSFLENAVVTRDAKADHGRGECVPSILNDFQTVITHADSS